MGKWIVLTGIDGAGKCEVGKFLTKTLKNHGYSVKYFRLPYFKWIKEMHWISGHGKPLGDPYTDALLFAAGDRLANYYIKEWKKFDFLLSHRGWVDSFVYRRVQGFTFSETANLLKIEELEKPDAIIFLECDVKTAFERLKGREKDKFETKPYLNKLSDGYKQFFTGLERKDKSLKFFEGVRVFKIDSRGLNSAKKQAEKTILEFALTKH